MAPNGSLDLPDLPRLFAGEQCILSWYNVPIHEWDAVKPSDSDLAYWIQILQDERTASRIRQDVPSFDTQNPTSAKRYETATAAINVAPATDKHYNITQIKSDSEWLAKELSLDEVQALKTVLLEWQNRPRLYLDSGYSEAEIASLNDAYGSQIAFDAGLQSSAFPLRDDDDFKTDTSRRRRQIFIYFQECIGLTRTWLALQDEQLARELGILRASVSSSSHSAVDSNIGKCIDLTVKLVNAFAFGPGPHWSVIDDETNYIWQLGHLFYAQNLMQAIVLLIRSVPVLSADPVRNWMKTMADVQFLRGVESSPLMLPTQLEQLNSLISLTTLALIDPANTISQLDSNPQQHWMTDFDACSEVHQILFNSIDQSCIPAVPAAFAWALVLRRVEICAIEAQHRRESPIHPRSTDIGTYDSATGRRTSMTGSTDESIFEHIMGAIRAVSPDPNSTGFLLEHTLETFAVADLLAIMGQSFTPELLPTVQKAKMKFLQEVIATAISELPEGERYGPNILVPQFAILSPPKSLYPVNSSDSETCKTFLATPVLTESILDVAAARFPYEALPFLRLCRQLARTHEFNNEGTQYVTFRLSELNSLTLVASGPFEAYHTIREDENLNLVALDQHAYAFPRSESSLITQDSGPQNSLVVPAETTGIVISTSEPSIIRWQYTYSGLTLIGEWLELYYNGLLQEALPGHESALDVATEMILLLSNLLLTTHNGNGEIRSREKAVDFILDACNAHLSSSLNVASLVFDIIEQELQAYRRKPTNSFDTELLCASVSFARAILKVRPTDFWQQISKTSLISPYGNASLLYTVIAGIESVSGNAALTEAAARLYQDIIEAALQRFISSSGGKPWRAKTGFNVLNNAEKNCEMVLSSLTSTMLEVFEAIPQWKQLLLPQGPWIVSTLSNCFDRIVRNRYGLGSTTSKLTSCFEGAAHLIMARMRPDMIVDAKPGPVLSHLIGVASLENVFTLARTSSLCDQSLFHLACTIISASKALALPPSGFETSLFDLAPVLIRRLSTLSSGDRLSASFLLQLLLTTVSVHRPVSLLGHLGTTSCIEVISILNTVLASAETSVSFDAWQLLTLLIGRDQQWLSVVILMGAVPDRQGEITQRETGVYRGNLIINKAMEFLRKADSLENQNQCLLKPILKFTIAAQQNWPWTLSSMRSRQEIFTSLMRYVTQSPRADRVESNAEHIFNTALITDLSSVHLQYAKSVRDLGLMKTFIPLVDWLTTNAIEVASYNRSMHTNLSKNFIAKFGLDLDDFKNNKLMAPEETKFYNSALADLVLGSNSMWKSTGNRLQHVHQSYHAEIERANENLRLVESELALLRSFQRLCIEHAAFFVQDQTIQKTMAHIAQRCLTANAMKCPAEHIFDTLLQTRCDMALALVQRLVEKHVRGSDFRELLKPAWEGATITNANYDQAIINGDLDYWRTSLTIVLLTLQFHLGPGWKPLPSKTPSSGDLLKHSTSIFPQVVELATVVIGRGLSTIVSTMQEQKQAQMQHQTQLETINVGIKDIVLITNTLETILRMARLPDFLEQLSDRLISTGTIQSTMKLYMWSHLLVGVDTNNDPVHAELATRLLVSLSSLPAVAEEMAVEGVLSSILTARITQALQKTPGGVDGLDQRVHCRNLYAIWADGIVPLSLNLLHAIGAPIAAEVTTFLNAFPDQLKKAGQAFRPREGEFVTLSLAKETATLSLLSFILDDYRDAGASAAVDPKSILPLYEFDNYKQAIATDVKEHLELERTVLKSKIVPTNDREVSWHQGNILVDKVLNQLKMASVCLQNEEEAEQAERGSEKAQGFRLFGD